MRYLVVDGMHSGTGIRDAVSGGYLTVDELGLSKTLSDKIVLWLNEYEDEHYNSYSNTENINRLDSMGLSIAKELQLELPDSKVEYYSSALLSKIRFKMK